MIRVAKSTNVPAELLNKGVPATASNCQLYESNSNGFNSGTVTFDINPNIYGHLSVKQQLISEQHGKCCFCEADFTANGYGDVEHFRPKAGFTITRTSKLVRPGYYWLAYEWTNLFFSCQICNQRFKRNYFPLEDESKRARNHMVDYQLKSCQLVHPSQDNPENHITFNRHIPKGKDKQGKLSVTAFGIGRPKLNSDREKHLQNVKNNIALSAIDLANLSDAERKQLSHFMKQPWPVLEQLILTAKAFMQTVAADTQPFSAMVRANFPDLI